jgi:hypothetical protein
LFSVDLYDERYKLQALPAYGAGIVKSAKWLVYRMGIRGVEVQFPAGNFLFFTTYRPTRQSKLAAD